MQSFQRARQAGFVCVRYLQNISVPQGMNKVIYGHMMQTLGFNYTKAMNPSTTSVVIAGDVKDESSAKVKTAMK